MILLLLYFFTTVSCSHFYGGFFGAEPKDENDTHINVKFLVRLGYKRSWIGSQTGSMEPNRSTYCNETTIENKVHISAYNYILCDVGCDHLDQIGTTDIICISYSVVNDWSYGENYFEYTLLKNTKYEAYYKGSAWVTLVRWTPNNPGGNWEMRIKITTTKRSDTGKMNYSPKTLVPPVLYLRKGTYIVLNIPQSDPDDDIVRCRWSIWDNDECASICETVPFAILNSSTCAMTFDLTNSSTTVGWYGAALQIEDFETETSTNPLSSTPLQFLIRVVSSASTCQVPPKLDNYNCKTIMVNQLFHMNITATVGCAGLSITEISIVGPTGLTYTQVAPVSGTAGQYFSKIIWTPTDTQVGEHLICITAIDNSPISSDVSCITVLVDTLPSTLKTPHFLSNSVQPSGFLFKSNYTYQNPVPFKVQINTIVYRPNVSSFIYIRHINGTEFKRFDIINSSQVLIITNITTNYSTISFSIPIDSLLSGIFYVTFDSPIASCNFVYSKYCTLNQIAGTNISTFWNFTIPDEPKILYFDMIRPICLNATKDRFQGSVTVDVVRMGITSISSVSFKIYNGQVVESTLYSSNISTINGQTFNCIFTWVPNTFAKYNICATAIDTLGQNSNELCYEIDVNLFGPPVFNNVTPSGVLQKTHVNSLESLTFKIYSMNVDIVPPTSMDQAYFYLYFSNGTKLISIDTYSVNVTYGLRVIHFNLSTSHISNTGTYYILYDQGVAYANNICKWPNMNQKSITFWRFDVQMENNSPNTLMYTSTNVTTVNYHQSCDSECITIITTSVVVSFLLILICSGLLTIFIIYKKKKNTINCEAPIQPTETLQQ